MPDSVHNDNSRLTGHPFIGSLLAAARAEAARAEVARAEAARVEAARAAAARIDTVCVNLSTFARAYVDAPDRAAAGAIIDAVALAVRILWGLGVRVALRIGAAAFSGDEADADAAATTAGALFYAAVLLVGGGTAAAEAIAAGYAEITAPADPRVVVAASSDGMMRVLAVGPAGAAAVVPGRPAPAEWVAWGGAPANLAAAIERAAAAAGVAVIAAYDAE